MYGIKIENNTLTILEGDANYLLDNKVDITKIRETLKDIEIEKEYMMENFKNFGYYTTCYIEPNEISKHVYALKVDIENKNIIIEYGDANSLIEQGFSIRNMSFTKKDIERKKKNAIRLYGLNK